MIHGSSLLILVCNTERWIITVTLSRVKALHSSLVGKHDKNECFLLCIIRFTSTSIFRLCSQWDGPTPSLCLQAVSVSIGYRPPQWHTALTVNSAGADLCSTATLSMTWWCLNSAHLRKFVKWSAIIRNYCKWSMERKIRIITKKWILSPLHIFCISAAALVAIL